MSSGLSGYRNAVYIPRDECVRLFTWNKDGKRINVDMPYKPYLYVEDKRGEDGTSLFNTKLRKKVFSNTQTRENGRVRNELGISQRRRFIDNLRPSDDSGGAVRVFENIQPEPQFLLDTFWDKVEDEDFNMYPLRIHYIDIETYSPDDFPHPEIAPDVVNVITLYDSLDKKFYSWGLGPCNYKQDDLIYVNCHSERELLLKFLNHIGKDHPDVITGWNIEFFDVPYLINRINKILGEDEVKRLSPINLIKERRFMGKFGKEMVRRHIAGVSVIDYLEIYKSFSQGLRESYKLDSIASLELGERKVDIGTTNLSGLADSDWSKFVEYNVQDVNLIIRLEEKLQYLQLTRMLATVGLTNLENALGTLATVTGAAIIQARTTTGVKVPTFIRSNDEGKYEGAYVGEPVRGFQDYIVSFDANSLYPNTMISLNLSPETKIGKITNTTDDEVTFQTVDGKCHTLSLAKFCKLVSDQELSISRAKVLCTQKKKGIFPAIVDKIYNQRVSIKKKLHKVKKELSECEDEAEKEKLQVKVHQQHILQLTLKILINRVYGYFGNKHSPMGDSDIARSITLTGQSVIKRANKSLREFVASKLDQEYTDDIDPIVYNDTDSSYITLKPIIDKFQIPFTNRAGNVSKEVHKLVQDVEDFVNDDITKWAKSQLNSKDPRFVFKRESICDVGVFLQKKRYVLHVLDDEGIKVNKFKYTGVEVVRSTIPASVKPHVKHCIETMLTTKNHSTTNKALSDAYETFKQLPIEDISFVMGITDYDKYADQCDQFMTAKRMPIHMKAAYYYNMMLDKENLTSEYEKIGSGDKVRYFYVMQPNMYGANVIGYKYYYPKEFESLFPPDTEKMFEKVIFSIMERFYESVGWSIQSPNKLVQTDLFELFGDD